MALKCAKGRAEWVGTDEPIGAASTAARCWLENTRRRRCSSNASALLEGLSGVFERGSRKAPDIDKERVRDLHVPSPGSTCLQVVRSDREHAVATFFGKIARAPVRDVRRGTSECDNPDLSIHCPAGVCEAICLEGSALRAADDRAVVALLPLQDADGAEPFADAIDRRAISRHAVLRDPPTSRATAAC